MRPIRFIAAAALVLILASAAFSQTAPRTVADLVKGAYGLTTFPIVVESDVTCLTSATQLTKQDAARFEDIFINTGTNQCLIKHAPSVTATSGIIVGGGGGNYVEGWRDDLFLPTQEMWCICPTASSTFHVVENKVQ